MPKQTSMFPNGEDTPLFSGTTQPGKESTFTKKDEPQQLALTDCKFCLGTGYFEFEILNGNQVIGKRRYNCLCNREGKE